MLTRWSWLPELLALHPVWVVTLFALVGLIFGSFSNVVIFRWPRQLLADWQNDAREALGLPVEPQKIPGIATGSSQCPNCYHAIAWYDNIPLLSWCFLKGRCRHCHNAISIQYPLVELLGALGCAVMGWRFGATPEGVVGAALWIVLLWSAGIDWLNLFLPDALTYTVLWSGLLVSLLHWSGRPSTESALIGVVVAWVGLWLLAKGFLILRHKEGMGAGDFKFLAAAAAWVGLQGLVPVLLIACVSGIIVALPTLLRKGRDIQIPFGPFLALGLVIQWIFPHWLL